MNEIANLNIFRTELPDPSVDLFVREPDELSFFGQLPSEIQAMIVIRAIPNNRKVNLLATRYSTPSGDVRISFTSKTPSPAILQVNHWSRQEVFMYYQCLLGSLSGGAPYTLFHPELDVVSIASTDHEMAHLCYNGNPNVGLDQYDSVSEKMMLRLRKVQYLELHDWTVSNDNSRTMRADVYLEHLKQPTLCCYLPSLKQVNLVVKFPFKHDPSRTRVTFLSYDEIAKLFLRFMDVFMAEKASLIPGFQKPVFSIERSKRTRRETAS